MNDGPVLVIDDSLTIRKLLEMTLGRAGHAHEMASLGREGLTMARRVKPRLILLDYVLPDVKGTEVCEELDRDPSTADVPVVIMSGKGDDIRPLFKSRRTVVDFVAKPFSPAEILHVIARALGRSAPSTAGASTPAVNERPTTSVYTATYSATPAAAATATAMEPARDQREAAARILFGALRERLARIPEWLVEVDGQPAAPFLARRLLTPEVVGSVLSGLTPLIGVPTVAAPLPPPAASPFAGSTAFLPVLQLLRLVADTHRTGVLHLGGDDGVDAWFERGDLRLASPREATAGRRVLATAGMAEEPGRAAGWSGAARAANVPLAVVVADECGPAGAAALRTIGRQALVRQTAEGPVEWSWSDLSALPEPVARASRPISIDQLALDRLRLVDDWSQVELDVSSLGQVCERVPAMRTRLPLFELTPEEAKVLLLVDGRRPVKDVLERSGLSTFDVFHILYRLIQVRLVQPRGEAPTRRPGPVLLCAGEGVAGPLADWLGRRGETLASCAPDGLLERILTAAPRLALVDLDGVADPEALARGVRARLEVSDTPLVALAPRADRGLQRALAEAGYDRVLAKPVHLNAIGRLLDGLEPGASP